ncbi:nitric oxide synthase oxygenase, partial [Bacillus thuringiensis]|uniref:nitric oxide synthase oxygenase n=1 Tax=Bacillus thuringiensis TaxID=1428 RepID=UPI0037BF00D6
MQEPIKKIQAHIENTGTYQHTFQQLLHPSPIPSPNSNPSIPTLFSTNIHILDPPELNHHQPLYHPLIHHIKYPT